MILKWLFSIRKSLIIIFVIAIFSILAMDFWLIKIVEPIYSLSITSSIYYKLCYAYIGAFVFYFINVHMQNESMKVKLHRYMHNKIWLIHDLSRRLIYCIQLANRIEKPKGYPFLPSEDELKKLLITINPHLPIVLNRGFQLSFTDWFQAINYIHQTTKALINDLMVVKEYLTSDIIMKLTYIEDNLEQHTNITKGKNLIGNQDMTFLSYSFEEYFKLTHELMILFRKSHKNYEEGYHSMITKENKKLRKQKIV